jgi:hypothetical protein
VAEYRHHQEFPAYLNLRANALLALDGSPGHVTEVLSGDYYQPLSTASPHQIWSAAMVISPVLRGMFGLERDAANKTLTFIPQAPASWMDYKIENIQVGKSVIAIEYHKVPGELTLKITRTGDECAFEFEPTLAGPAMEVRAEVNGRQTPVDFKFNPEHHHIQLKIALQEGKNTVRLRVKNDFGRGGASYDLTVWNADVIASLEGAELVKEANGTTKLRVHFETEKEEYGRKEIAIHFRQSKVGGKAKLKE